MYVTPKRMRRADAPVPAHVMAIAEAQRAALAERITAQAEQPKPAYMPVSTGGRRKARKVALTQC